MLRHPLKRQILIESRYLLVVAFAFLFVPAKEQVEQVVRKLALNQVGPSGQWAAVIFLTGVPLLVLVIPGIRLLKAELADIRTNGLQQSWRSLTTVLSPVLLLSTYCIIRALFWVN